MKMGNRFWWAAWVVTLVGFIVGGAMAKVLVGSVDAPLSSLLAGVVAGAVIGTAQWLVLRKEFPAAHAWTVATAVGLGFGLAAGAALVSYRTGAVDLALMGAFTGLGVGILQALVLRKHVTQAWRWVLLSPPLWAVSWLITLGIGIDVAAQWAVFGLSGAIFYTVVAGFVLRLMLQTSPVLATTGGTG
jgi:hypothetical protein